MTIERRTFCPEDGRACYTPQGDEPEGYRCLNYDLCKSFESRPQPIVTTDGLVEHDDAAFADWLLKRANEEEEDIGLGADLSLASERITSLTDRIASLERALTELEQAEAEYRSRHDLWGDGSPEAGRAWDAMRRAGNKARELLRALSTTHPLNGDDD